MATNAICGCNGTVSAGDATEVTDWKINQSVDVLDATSFDSVGWKERVGCLRRASGTFRCIGAKPTLGPATGSFSTAVTGGLTVSGSIIINKVTKEVVIDSLVSYNCGFVFTGTITCSGIQPSV